MNSEGNLSNGDPEKRSIEDVLRGEKLRYLSLGDVVETVATGSPLRGALELLKERRAVLVEKEGLVTGIFTERDYLDKLAGVTVDLDRPIDEFMTPDPQAVSPDDTIDTVMKLMTKGGYRHLPVVAADGSVVGLVSSRDIIEHFAEFFPVEIYNLPPRLHQDQAINSREGG
jgi:CBS domain-containing protein